VTQRGVLLADEMGLGKTVQVIAYINFNTDIRSVLIVCPASLKINWRNELKAWLVKQMTVSVINGDVGDLTTDIVIINYDILKRHIDKLCAMDWSLIVGDESQSIKSGKAQRSRAFLKLTSHRRVLLTGTPILNRPEELWTSLKWLDPHSWTNWYEFVTRYCAAHRDRFGLNTSGSSNLAELNRILRSTIMIRRLKRDVLPELPPKVRQIIEVPCADMALINTEIAKWKEWKRAEIRLKVLERKAKIMHKESEFADRIKAMRQDVFAGFAELSKARHDTAVYKLPTIIAHLKSAIESGHKLVFFAHHRDVLTEVQVAFPNISVVLMGGMTTTAKDFAVTRFQTDDTCRLFVGSLKAAGVGLTLTASSHTVFGEIDWSPAVITQAEDRLARIGQKNSVLVQHIVLEGSLDVLLAKKIVAKQEVIDRALGDNT